MSLARELGEALLARGEWLALAESCTGGLIAKRCTDVAGSSRWFERGLVTYSNRAKQDLLDVPESLLIAHGAVSQACAEAMVEGLLRNCPAQWGLAVTGIAGPGGGSADKPVGTVWIGLQRRATATRSRLFRFAGDREAVREQAAQDALELLRDALHA